jgi:hypothetical protein
VREGEEVAERRHAVCTTGTGVSSGERAQVGDVVDGKDLGLDLRQGNTDGGTGRRDVLERSGGREVEALRKLLNERPRVERVKEVDVAGRAREDCSWSAFNS